MITTLGYARDDGNEGAATANVRFCDDSHPGNSAAGCEAGLFIGQGVSTDSGGLLVAPNGALLGPNDPLVKTNGSIISRNAGIDSGLTVEGGVWARRACNNVTAGYDVLAADVDGPVNRCRPGEQRGAHLQGQGRIRQCPDGG